ncbi:hypothetical protein R1flu_019125 [Riccia fluitans]|uniref:Peptidyl-prolyl cis-trans isomerase n=1 Tax=Riccia fluitans TaxID=41844 RepID=A0ABD1ZI31_9MARC
MAVQLETSLGEIVVDLHCDQCPLTCKNFLKLCKIKYYNNCIFHDVKKDFIAQTGDPTGTGSGGDSVYKSLYGDQARFFDDEIHPKLTHEKIGTVAMASAGENLNASQFYITLRAGLDYLDGKHTVFGEVAEGLETLMRINEAYVDENGRPYKNIRIKHVNILEDPFDDPPALADMLPDKSPELKPPAEGEEVRLEDDWVPMDELMDPEEVDKSLRKKEAHSQAVVLEMIGDIPDAEIAPPENVLFICKLNPVTEEEDLHTLFSRFGKIISADIIRDYKTGESLCYGFIEFETKEACEAAYFKMDSVLIDDRRIHVDFSQSVSKLWTRFRKFGAKDSNGHGPDAQQSRRGKSGCFNCGEFGHLKKDCPHGPDGAKDAVANDKPKYSLKEPGGQRGDPRRRYEMVFDEDSGATESEKASGLSNFRVYHDERPPLKRPSRDDGEEKRARLRVSPRYRNDGRSYRSDTEVRTGRRDEMKVDERSRGRGTDRERQIRVSPPPALSGGRSDESGVQFGRPDRDRERGDYSTRDDPRRRELKYHESGDSITEERIDSRRRHERDHSRRVEEGNLRRDPAEERRKGERGDSIKEERIDSRRRDKRDDSREDEIVDIRRDVAEQRRKDRDSLRRDDRGEPRRDGGSEFRRGDRGEASREERSGLRRDDKKEPRREGRREPRREEKFIHGRTTEKNQDET